MKNMVKLLGMGRLTRSPLLHLVQDILRGIGTMKRLFWLLAGGLLTSTLSGLWTHAQGSMSVDCSPEALARQQSTFASILSLDFANQPDLATANLFRLGAVYQQMALACGYAPSETEVDAQILQTLALADLARIVAARSVGTDTEAIVAQLAAGEVFGDSYSGQLLYNGLENGLDGSPLGCSGCHNGQTAPAVEGTWTRVTEERLNDPALAGYDVTQYLVESILHPNAYVVEAYTPDLMPPYYGQRLDLQQLADLVAYLDSQDQ